jgi:putative ABC transport system permease protein
MTKGLKRNIRRCITGSMGRFIAILLIIMLGVGFFTGLRLTHPDMSAVETKYVRSTQLYDLRVLSTIGFDDDDVSAVLNCDGVTAAVGSVNADFIWIRDGKDTVWRTHMLTDGINEPELVAGRMPEAGNECVVDAQKFTEDDIGTVIPIDNSCNTEDTCNNFAYDSYTIVGLVDSSLYMNVERGTTSLGTGSLSGFILIPKDGYKYEYYTELYVKMDDSAELYSDEYDEQLDALKDAVEPAVTASVNARFDKLKSDAQAEIDDGQQELDESVSDAKVELEDAKQQLSDAQQTLTDGQADLDSAKNQLDDAKVQLDSAAAQIQPNYTSWRGALEHGRNSYQDGVNQLNEAITAAQQKLDESKTQLQTAQEQYDENLTSYEQGVETLAQYNAQWQAGKDQLDASYAQYQQNLSDWQSGWDSYEQAKAQYDALSATLPQENAESWKAQLEDAKTQLDAQKTQLDQWYAQLEQSSSQLNDQKIQLDAQSDELASAKAQLDAVKEQLDDGWAQLNAGQAELDAQKTKQQAQLDTAKASLDQFESGIEQYESGLASYESGKETLEDGQQEYNDGVKEYEDGVAELDSQTADAESKLNDARQELSDLQEPVLYLLDRSTNTGYASFDSDSQIVERVATVFPIFFFLIAALVCSTTMTRMIDDERTQIGTLRALGYSRGAILSKYLIYSGSAAVTGCILGYFGGGALFPLVIWTAYKMLYNIPGMVYTFSLPLFLVALGASLLCSAGTTFFACRHEMRSTPADLIRPKTPSAGKRILLERITPLWKRLKFLHKVSLRNIFRFKKRMFMMILGIAGCTALLITGFGIHDSVANIANYQFDDIQKYDLVVSCTEQISDDLLDRIDENYGDKISADAVALMGAGDATGNDATKSVNIVVSDDSAITDIIDLHRNGSAVSYPGTGKVVLTEKLADLIGAKIGDTITLSLGDDERADFTVSGLAENYVNNYVYLTGESYQQAFGKEFEAKTLLIQLNEDSDEYALSASLSNEDGVSAVTVITDTRKMIDNMMVSLNYVVALVVACAAALAFIVLFNLGNINISERVREIATIKVLGFHARESGAYVFRENIMLAIMGIVCGLPLGIALHTFVMSQIKVDLVAFKYVIRPISYLLSVILVLLFTIATDLIMRRKIAAIDMAESLKSVE